jgi:ATP-dependent Clp protease ATP-binding subunit ClpX
VGERVIFPPFHLLIKIFDMATVQNTQHISQIDIYKQILQDFPNIDIQKPHQIKEKLDDYVIGNENAKRILSTAIYNHYKKISYKGPVEFDKSNILLLGPTGSGKTYLIQSIARFLNVPCHITDCTTLTESGYVGSDVETVLDGLLTKANGNLLRAQMGICVLDEIDKIGRKSENVSITRDVSGEGVQQALLKLLESSEVQIQPGSKRHHPEKEFITFNTKNVLFICMGAFEGIEKKIRKRLNMYKVGYTENNSRKEIVDSDILQQATTEDLRTFGIIPELIGRLPIMTSTEYLNRDALMKIMTQPKNSIVEQYTELFGLDGCELIFDNGALEAIADHAITLKTGARSLRSTVEKILQDHMFDVPKGEKKKIKITKKYVMDKIAKNETK